MDAISYRARCEQIAGEYETYMRHVVYDGEGNVIGISGPAKAFLGTGPCYHIGASPPPPKEQKATEKRN